MGNDSLWILLWPLLASIAFIAYIVVVRQRHERIDKSYVIIVGSSFLLLIALLVYFG